MEGFEIRNSDRHPRSILAVALLQHEAFIRGKLMTLPVEKQFTHTVFVSKIENIDLHTARKLLEELHLLYLLQQVMLIKIAKQDLGR